MLEGKGFSIQETDHGLKVEDPEIILALIPEGSE
jgi:hypothetical protein